MNIFTVTYFVLTFLYLTWFCNHWIETPLFLCTQYWIDERTTTYSWCLLVYLFAETGVGAVIITGWAIAIADPTGVTPNLIRASTWKKRESVKRWAKNRNTTSNSNFKLNKTHLSVSATGRAWATTTIRRTIHGLFRYAILCNCSIDHAWRIAHLTATKICQYSPNAAHWKNVACISFLSQHTKIYGLAAVSEEER